MKRFIYIASLIISFIYIFAGVLIGFDFLEEGVNSIGNSGGGEFAAIKEFFEMLSFVFYILAALLGGAIFIGGGVLSGVLAKIAYNLFVDYRGNRKKGYFIFVSSSFMINIIIGCLLYIQLFV